MFIPTLLLILCSIHYSQTMARFELPPDYVQTVSAADPKPVTGFNIHDIKKNFTAAFFGHKPTFDWKIDPNEAIVFIIISTECFEFAMKIDNLKRLESIIDVHSKDDPKVNYIVLGGRGMSGSSEANGPLNKLILKLTKQNENTDKISIFGLQDFAKRYYNIHNKPIKQFESGLLYSFFRPINPHIDLYDVNREIGKFFHSPKLDVAPYDQEHKLVFLLLTPTSYERLTNPKRPSTNWNEFTKLINKIRSEDEKPDFYLVNGNAWSFHQVMELLLEAIDKFSSKHPQSISLLGVDDYDQKEYQCRTETTLIRHDNEAISSFLAKLKQSNDGLFSSLRRNISCIIDKLKNVRNK